MKKLFLSAASLLLAVFYADAQTFPPPADILGDTSGCIGVVTMFYDVDYTLVGSGYACSWSVSALPGVVSVVAMGDTIIGGNMKYIKILGTGGGSASVSYDVAIKGTVSTILHVNIPPALPPSTAVCTGASISLGSSGGTWSSSHPSVATVDGAGTVTGVSGGTTVITYATTSTCSATETVYVDTPLHTPASISGTPFACVGSTAALSDATVGGTWSSISTGVATIGSAGLTTGVSAGTSTISYTLSNTCGSVAAMATFTVNTVPATPAPISGAASLCQGATTVLIDATAGGAWSSGTSGIATVNSGGTVSGIAAGAATISYIITNGCGSAFAITSVTVNPLQATPASISGSASLCQGATGTLGDATAGGSWHSSAPGIVSVSGAGIVDGVSVGTATISYTETNGCGAAASYLNITVNSRPATPDTILGAGSVLAGSTIMLSDATPGGSWSVATTATGTIDASGNFTGLAAGTDAVFYTISNSCGSFTANKIIVISTGSTGVDNVGNAFGISVFPNPAKDRIVIQGQLDGQAEVLISDMTGREVYRRSFLAEKGGAGNALDLSTLPVGAYILNVQSAQVSGHAKIIIQ